MRKLFTAAVLTFGIFGSTAFAADLVGSATSDTGDKVGVGIGFSGLTGLSVYADTSHQNFVQGAVGFAPYGSYAVSADYAFGYRNAISSAPSVTPFWGIGAIILHDQNDYWQRYSYNGGISTTYVGARIPLGINFVIPTTPVQLSAELVPSVLLTPATYSYLEGDFNVRILF